MIIEKYVAELIFMKNNRYGSPLGLIWDSFEVFEDHWTAVVVVAEELAHVNR